MFLLPASWCRPSIFCVTRVKLGFSFSRLTSALWLGFGFASFAIPLLQSYHSQTSLGSLWNASWLASSSDLYFLHNPSFPRNVGIPLSAEMPAPVRTTILDEFSIIALASFIWSSIFYLLIN